MVSELNHAQTVSLQLMQLSLSINVTAASAAPELSSAWGRMSTSVQLWYCALQLIREEKELKLLIFSQGDVERMLTSGARALRQPGKRGQDATAGPCARCHVTGSRLHDGERSCKPPGATATASALRRACEECRVAQVSLLFCVVQHCSVLAADHAAHLWRAQAWTSPGLCAVPLPGLSELLPISLRCRGAASSKCSACSLKLPAACSACNRRTTAIMLLCRPRAAVLAHKQPRRQRLRATGAASVDVAGPVAPAPLSELPEPTGEWSLLPWAETAEWSRDHFAWAHKRCGHFLHGFRQSCARVSTLSSFGRRMDSHAPTPCKGRGRVQKHGPVFMSNLYGSKTVVVADFAGWEKVRRCGAARLCQVHHACLLFAAYAGMLWHFVPLSVCDSFDVAID